MTNGNKQRLVQRLEEVQERLDAANYFTFTSGITLEIKRLCDIVKKIIEEDDYIKSSAELDY